MICLVVFDGVELSGAIECEDPGILRDLDSRHGNVVIPGVQGTTPVEPIVDELDRTLTWSVTGRFDPDGDPYSDRQTGVEENLEYYRGLFDPRGGASGTGLYSLELRYAAKILVGSAQVVQYGQVRTGPTTARIVTRLIITGGELDESGS